MTTNTDKKFRINDSVERIESCSKIIRLISPKIKYGSEIRKKYVSVLLLFSHETLKELATKPRAYLQGLFTKEKIDLISKSSITLLSHGYNRDGIPDYDVIDRDPVMIWLDTKLLREGHMLDIHDIETLEI